MKSPSDKAETLGDDLLYGCREIGKFINQEPAQVYWHIVRGRFPTTRLGKMYVCRKSELSRLFSTNGA